jgi:hypothetical protein
MPEETDGKDAKGLILWRPCPVCQAGVQLVTIWPRSTIAETMRMPLEQLR